MTTPFNVGVLQLSMEPAHETIEMAKACEHAGFDAFWIAEAYPWWRKHGFEARLCSDDGENGGRRTRLEAMLAPPGIGLSNPKRVKASAFAGFGHRHSFVHRFHAELQNTDIEGDGHFLRGLLYSGSCQECSRPLINCHSALFSGVGTPTFWPQLVMSPFMKSTSVWRLARTSCSMLARCFPGALAPF